MLKFIALNAASIALSLSAYADHHKGDHHGKHKIPECDGVKKACEDAGFKMGGHKEGKGMIMDCMHKLAKGEKLIGVPVDPADATTKACFAKLKEKHMAKMKHKMDDAGAPAAPTEAPKATSGH